MSYELTDETRKSPTGVVVYRIRATRDIPEQGVKAGDLGGFISYNAVMFDNAWVADDAMLFGYAGATENARISGKARVGGSSHIKGHAHVGGRAKVLEFAVVQDNAVVKDRTVIKGASRVVGDTVVEGEEVINTFSNGTPIE